MPLSAVLEQPWKIDIQERPRRALHPHEARIGVAFAGVCGTDLAIYSGDYPVPLPLVLGHEFAGTVVEVGAQSDNPLLGARVTAEINNTCFAQRASDPCEACRRGLAHHCQRRTVVGIVNCDGAFASEIVAPSENIHLLPESVSFEEAVFVEPLAAALQTFVMGPLGGGGDEGQPLDGPPWVEILGVGRLGLLIAAVAHALGARVIGIGRTAEKIRQAEPYCTATIVSDDPGHVVRRTRDLTKGLGADYVVEATGSPQGVNFARQLVRPRGIIALKSTPGIPVDGLDLTGLVVDEIRLQGSRCGPFREAIDFLASGKVNVRALISEKYPLRQSAAAIERAAHVPKVLIQCAS